MQTMFDLYHPLGDRQSYFVWFSGEKSPYPRRVGFCEFAIPEQPQPRDFVTPQLWDDLEALGPRTGRPAGLTMWCIHEERHRCKTRGLRLPLIHLRSPTETRTISPRPDSGWLTLLYTVRDSRMSMLPSTLSSCGASGWCSHRTDTTCLEE